jgi:hypothetical protein
VDTSWLRRYRLIGDENCGVGIECRDHFDGGRPLAYYDSSGEQSPDPAVQNVATIPGLIAAAEVHEHEMHGPATRQAINVTIKNLADGFLTAKAVQDAVRSNPLRGR